MTLVEHLLAGAPDDPIAVELGEWIAASRAFRAFAEANRDKVRKKLRTATDPAARRDVRAELRVAFLLLADRRIDLAFEAYGSTKGGPDFTVSFRGERPFNLEVTRSRRAAADGPILAKLRQLPPGVPNALLISVEGPDAAALDVPTAVRALRARADARDEEFFARRGLEGSRRFYERFLRLGAVIVLADEAAGEARATAWPNPSARIAVPARALRACLAALRREAASGS